MSDPKIFVLFFIAFIGLVYILSTCQWKSSTDGTGSNDGNSESKSPPVAKALTTSDQNTRTNNQGEQFTIQCPDVGGNTVPIHKITSALYRCGKAHTDITQQIGKNCNDQNVCTVHTTWDGSNAWLYVAASAPEIIEDPHYGCPKEIDVSYSCRWSQAQSKLIKEYGTDEENTISCDNAEYVLRLESAWWKSIHDGSDKINALGHVELQKCNGRNSCTINPINYNQGGKKPLSSFKIKNVSNLPPTSQCVTSEVTRSDSLGTERLYHDHCTGMDDPAPGYEKELAIVYYCSKTYTFQGQGKLQIPQCTSGTMKLVVAEMKTVSPDQTFDATRVLQPCFGQKACKVTQEGSNAPTIAYDNWNNEVSIELGEGIGNAEQITIDYYCE